MTKRKRTLRERNPNYNTKYWRFVRRASEWAGERFGYDSMGPRWVCAAEGWKAGYRAGKREGKAEAMKACGWGEGK